MTKQSNSISARNPQFPSGDNPTRRAVVAGVASALPAAALAAAAIPAVASPTTGETVMNAFTKIQGANHSPLSEAGHDRMLELVTQLRAAIAEFNAGDYETDEEADAEHRRLVGSVELQIINERPAIVTRKGALVAFEYLLEEAKEQMLDFMPPEHWSPEELGGRFDHMCWVIAQSIREYLSAEKGPSTSDQELRATDVLSRFAFAIKTLSMRVDWMDQAGYHFDQGAAERALAYWRRQVRINPHCKNDPTEGDVDGASFYDFVRFARTHGPSCDWVITGNVETLLHGYAQATHEGPLPNGAS